MLLFQRWHQHDPSPHQFLILGLGPGKGWFKRRKESAKQQMNVKTQKRNEERWCIVSQLIKIYAQHQMVLSYELYFETHVMITHTFTRLLLLLNQAERKLKTLGARLLLNQPLPGPKPRMRNRWGEGCCWCYRWNSTMSVYELTDLLL